MRPGAPSGFARYADVGVDVRKDAVVPDEAGAFETPEVPRLLRLRVLVLVEGQVDLLKAALALDDFQDFVSVLLPVRREDVAHDLLDEILLLLRQLSEGDARLGLARGAEFDGGQSLARRALDDRLLPLRRGERLEDGERALGLVIEKVLRAVAVGTVAVIERPAEGDAFFGVAVATDGQVMAG